MQILEQVSLPACLPTRVPPCHPACLPAWRSLHLNANYLKRMALLPRARDSLFPPLRPSSFRPSQKRLLAAPPSTAPLFTPFSHPLHASPTCLGCSAGKMAFSIYPAPQTHSQVAIRHSVEIHCPQKVSKKLPMSYTVPTGLPRA